MLSPIFDLDNYFLNLHAIPYFLAGILVAFEGFFIFFQNRKSLLHTSFMLTAITTAIWLTGVSIFYSAKYENVALFWIRNYCWLGVIFIAPSFHFFSACWRGVLDRQTKWVIFNFACGLILALLCVTTTLVVKGAWKYPWGFFTKAGILCALFPIWFYAIMSFFLWNFIRAYKEATLPIKRRQTKSIILAFSIAFTGTIDFLPNYGIAIYPVGYLSILIFLTIIGYSIIRYKLLDIETVLHKTLAWFLTNIALVLPLVVLLYLTSGWYLRLNPLGTWSYLAGVLLTFLLFVKTFQTRVDHFFQRGRYDLEAVLNQFFDDLVHLRGLEEVVNKITDTIVDTLFPKKVILFVYDESLKKLITVGSLRESLKANLQLDPESPFFKWMAKNNRILNRELIEIDPRCERFRAEAEEYFKILDTLLCIPLVLDERLIGLVNLGRKAGLKPYGYLDLVFLNRLRNQATIAISNSLAYDRVDQMVKLKTEELIHIEGQLIQAEKLATVGTLAGGVAHEINNPLAAILINTQLLLTSVKGEDKRVSLTLIETATQRCRDIVKNLMAYSKNPQGEHGGTQSTIRFIKS